MGKTINIMIGLPGCGKSTFCEKMVEEWGGCWVSRDKIRLEMLGPNASFFSQETNVFNCFVNTINTLLTSDKDLDIYIDATHINSSSRLKILRRLNLKGDEDICYYIFTTPLNECMRRNRLRTGVARVPDNAIRDMNARAQFYITDAEERAYHPIEYRVDFKGEIEE